ncbi:hypothetical protein RQP46_001141 [Phenoliferia psychrophenolica]
MAGRIPVGKAFLMTAVITSLGYGVMALTTPSEAQFYDSLAPDLQRKVDQNRAMKAEAEVRAKQLAAINVSLSFACGEAGVADPGR